LQYKTSQPLKPSTAPQPMRSMGHHAPTPIGMQSQPIKKNSRGMTTHLSNPNHPVL
jgi:hypothetical protein